MNERIRELVEQSYVKVRGHGAFGESETYHQVDLEKFAELIIQECAELTLDYKNDDHYNGWLDYRDKIRQHFGVER